MSSEFNASAVLSNLLSAVARGDTAGIIQTAEKAAGSLTDLPIARAVLRTAIFHPRQGSLYYLRLLNAWTRAGCPPLKPAVRQAKIRVVSDVTVTGYPPLLRLFGAAFGLDLAIELAPFDSIEQDALGESAGADIVVVMPSEHWLRRHLGQDTLIAPSAVDQVRRLLDQIIDAYRLRGSTVLMPAFASRAWARPGAWSNFDGMLGWNAVVAELNVSLARRQGEGFAVIDFADPLAATGQPAFARLGHVRARLAFEEAGLVVTAREMATVIAAQLGKGHRAMVLDWDNTLWGGEVGDLGSMGICCGQEGQEALGYYRLQEFLAELPRMGVALGAASRNDPKVSVVWHENRQLALKADDFAVMQVHWGPKSESLTAISRSLRFGCDLMVFMDDNLLEIADVLTAHPDIDVLIAGPAPLDSLDRLAASRFFQPALLSGEDVARRDKLRALVQQDEVATSAGNMAEFLRTLEIRIRIDDLEPHNEERILQLLQKTNQFNLTTRRHGRAKLEQMRQAGVIFGVISYEDRFASQGIIGFVAVEPGQFDARIDTWLMSCRVLNRGVEQAVLDWMSRQIGDLPLIGEYLPTEKNGLVADLFSRLGFDPLPGRPDGQLWSRPAGRELPAHHAIIEGHGR